MLLGLDYELSLFMGAVINFTNQKLPCIGIGSVHYSAATREKKHRFPVEYELG